MNLNKQLWNLLSVKYKISHDYDPKEFVHEIFSAPYFSCFFVSQRVLRENQLVTKNIWNFQIKTSMLSWYFSSSTFSLFQNHFHLFLHMTNDLNIFWGILLVVWWNKNVIFYESLKNTELGIYSLVFIRVVNFLLERNVLDLKEQVESDKNWNPGFFVWIDQKFQIRFFLWFQ